MAHDTRITFSYLFLFSGFVRYAIQPKDDKILFLLSTAFGKQTETDKIKIIKGLKVRFFACLSSTTLTVPFLFLNGLMRATANYRIDRGSDFLVAVYPERSEG